MSVMDSISRGKAFIRPIHTVKISIKLFLNGGTILFLFHLTSPRYLLVQNPVHSTLRWYSTIS